MKVIANPPGKSISKAYLKLKPLRADFDFFINELKNILNSINLNESEEHNKGFLSNFLRNTFYKNNCVNTKDRADLVIYSGADSKSKAGALIEVKHPLKNSEMITKTNLNAKAMHEAMLYYFRERIEEKNDEIKHVVITNIYEWFIFDAVSFENIFFRNTDLRRSYEDWNNKQKVSSNTPHFYDEIARAFLNKCDKEIEFTYFDLRNYGKNEKELALLFKLFSPENLLKKPFANDSNSLNRPFYNELLHIIGLEEVKDGSKKIIRRKDEKTRENGALLENTLGKLETKDVLNQINKGRYGSEKGEQMFNIALELNITWINRLLFLKLLEAQLINYNKGDKKYKFLDAGIITEFDILHELFHDVLAQKPENRGGDILKQFSGIPYLNSSLFELSELERKAIDISGLKDRHKITYFSATVLTDGQKKKRKGEVSTLKYLLEFLDAHNFGADAGSSEIQEESKTIINASVLGRIFEKINGYKEGSIFTPGFITMYMCRETIRRAVVQKFNEEYSKNAVGIGKRTVGTEERPVATQERPVATEERPVGIEERRVGTGRRPVGTEEWRVASQNVFNNFEELKREIDRSAKGREEANRIINSLKICDPAVGSGHFLVSALNEIIAIKSELGVLNYRDGGKLQGCSIEIENDELIITDDETGELFNYHLNDKGETIPRLQKLQETLFHEKQTIIENCLFGVDINPNSVNICRLRLWIELLKNAYYLPGTKQLETLPNIDINIKQGNSLISRYPLDADIKTALKKSKWSVESYRAAVMTYRNARTKDEKREMEGLINSIKGDFVSEISAKDRRVLRKQKLTGDLYNLNNQFSLFALTEKEKEKWEKDVNTISAEIKKLETEIEEIKNNKIYENAFEWRFEFPEVLDYEGNFKGFDVVIGNPPYIRQEEFADIKSLLKENYKIYHSIADLLTYFVELGYKILKTDGAFQFIISNKFTRTNYGSVMRSFLKDNTRLINFIDFGGYSVFDEATVDPAILTFNKSIQENSNFVHCKIEKDFNGDIENYLKQNSQFIMQNNLPENTWSFESDIVTKIKLKVEAQGIKLKNWDITINYGIKTGLNEAFVIDEKTKNELIAKDPKNAELLKPMLRGRDIQKWYPDYQNLWLINSHNGIKEKGIKRIDIENEFPTIFNYFKSFKDNLLKRIDQGDHWTNLRNCAYLEEFEKPKIVYPNMTKYLPFVYDEEKYYTNQKCFILIGAKLKYLISFLNSKLFKYCFKDNFPELLGGTRELSKVFFEEIPVKQVSAEQEEVFKEKVDQILLAKKENPKADTSLLEAEIDRLVYELYGLTEEEIKIVEG